MAGEDERDSSIAPSSSAGGDSAAGGRKKERWVQSSQHPPATTQPRTHRHGEHEKAVDLDEKKSAEAREHCKLQAASGGSYRSCMRPHQEALFMSMYSLVKEKGAEPWQFTGVKIIMEGLVGLLVLFNPQRSFWDINEDQWLWKIVRWSVFRSPIASLYGYDAFCKFLFVLVGLVFAELLGVAFLAWSMRKSERTTWIKTLSKTLQVISDVMFGVLYMSILDYFLFFSACDFTATPIMHVYFTDVYCMAMPHLAYMAIAGATAVLFCIATIAVQTASCDLNPTAKGVMASPAAIMKIKVVFCKAVYILAMNTLTFLPKPQALLAALMVLYVVWLNFHVAPFFRGWVNCIWVGMWCSVLFTAALYTALAFSAQNDELDYQDSMTLMVLYGVWPTLLVGGAVTWWWLRRRLANAAKFQDPNVDKTKLKKVHRFANPGEAELVCRAMRKFDLDGNIDPDAADLGELIIKAGLATFPNSAQLLVLYSNFLMEVRKDGPASRAQLQLVAKQTPNFVERYQAFCTAENSKRLKESSDQGMDLHSYVEFRRMFRGVMRVHKDALMQIRELWAVAAKPDPKTARLDAALRDCDVAIDRAQRIYRRVVERYPKNGKLLKVYGSFLEDVKSDMQGATRVYSKAMRQGGAGNGLMSMDFDFASQPGKPEMLLSMDINEDAIVMINAEGQIMLVSAGVTPLFGYAKAELEGQNVAMLMPAPFNQRHPSYLQRYKDTGEARILDSVKEVVGLHKDKHVFPCQVCVTKLSGVGADAVFLGMLRPLAFSKRDVRAWLSPNGVIMCCGPMFSALTGILPEVMVGANIKTMVAEAEEFEALLQRGMSATAAEFESDSLAMELTLLNKYIGRVPCNIHVSMGGTEQTRMFVLHLQRKDEADDNLMVVDEEGNITFATIDLAVTLGYPLKHFLKLNMRQILPPPINAMHEKWLRDSPPSYPVTSCRAGCVVNLLGSTNQQVAVRLQLTQREEPSGLKHVARVFKMSPNQFLDDRRVTIITGYDGIITSVEPENAIFGFPSALLKGLSVCDVIDVFSDWQDKSGSGDMQLLMLALLDKEHEMPGAAWRIKLTPPESVNDGKALHLGSKSLNRASVLNRRQPKSAIMQASLVETRVTASQQKEQEEEASQRRLQRMQTNMDDDRLKPKVRLVLWRRELLVGSMELDTSLRVRRADVSSGLIMGRPPGLVLKQPLWKFLKIPRKSAWDDVMDVNRNSKRSALKTTPTLGKISAIKAFEGDHPDGGSMRILIQGVVITDAMNGKSRIEITIKPDMTFAAAHSDIWGALGLNCFDMLDGSEGSHRSSRSGSSHHHDGGGGGGGGVVASIIVQRPSIKGARFALPPPPEEEGPVGRAHAEPHISEDGGAPPPAPGGGDFIKRWVQTMDATARTNSGRMHMKPGGGGDTGEIEEDVAAAAKVTENDWVKIAESMPDEAFAMPAQPHHRHHHHHRSDAAAHPTDANDAGKPDNASDAESASDMASSVEDEEQRSSYSSKIETHEDEILVDSRRAKVLRKLLFALSQPSMRQPVWDIKIRTCVVLALMLLVRVVFYIATAQLMAQQTVYIDQVQESAGCADRSQVITVTAAVATYCRDQPALIAGDNICHTLAPQLSALLAQVELDIVDLEQFSQDVYLGHSGKVQQLTDATTYHAWSEINVQFTVYLDTAPPTALNATRSLFELNNRFAAAARELLWLIDYQNTTDIIRSRAYNFVTLNGVDTVFTAYTNALDAMMVFSWSQLTAIRGDIAALMVLEALVFTPLLMFWMWRLIRAAEGVRTVQYMLLVLLPAPVLRTLSTRPVTIAEDSDSDSDDGGSEDGGGGGDDPKPAADPSSKAAGTTATSAIGAASEPSCASAKTLLPVAAKPLDPDDEPAPVPVAAAPRKGRRGGAASRRLAPAFKHYILFLGPLAAWFVTLLVLYGISLSEVTSLQQPLAALNMAMHVIYRFSHVRALAFFLASQSTDAAKDVWRAKLVTAVADLTSEYDTLMYGGVATTQANAMFQQPVPAAAFILPSFSAMFFSDTKCMRNDLSTCYTPDSPWYEATHHGLDAMMQRIITEMGLMTQDSYADLNVANNTRYQTMYHIGIDDLYDGLQTAAQLLVNYSVSRYNQIASLQAVLLAILVVLELVYLAFVLRPYLALHNAAVSKIAGVVSHAPQEVDVSAHARRIVRRGPAANAKPKASVEAQQKLLPVGSDVGSLSTAPDASEQQLSFVRSPSQL